MDFIPMNRIKALFIVLAAIAFASIPLLVQATQITPNPNPVGSTLDIINDPFAENTANPFVNAGTLNIDSSSTLTNSVGAALNNDGILNNAGIIENHRGTLNNAGTVNNLGTWHEFATFPLSSTNSVGATVNNYGVMDIDQSNYNNQGTLNNFGTFVVYHASPTNSVGATLNNYGTINFDQTGSLNNDGTLNNLGSWKGFVGTVTNSVGATLNNYGEINVDRLSLTNAGTLNNFAGATLATNDGSYLQTAGQTINNGSLTLTSITIQGGTLSGTGTITGDVTIGSGATVSPGNPFGTLTINGAFASSGNTLFEIGGRSAAQFDVLRINGSALFTGGTLSIDFLNFTPKVGNSWNFFYAKSISGWDSLSFLVSGLGAGETAKFRFHNGIETLKIVRAHDRSTLGLVAASDPSPRGMVAVPEPSTLLFLVLGLGGLALWRGLKRV